MRFCEELRPSRRVDVVVMGAGPSGLALGSELARGGALVASVAPRPEAAWKPNYGVFLDDLESSLVSACVRHVWRAPFVQLDPARRVPLDRAYGRFDNDTLQAHLAGELRRHGGRSIAGRAVRIEHDADGSRVHLGDGSHLDASVVVDATGADSQFVRRPARQLAFQSAYGELVRVERHGFASGEMPLMDFRGESSPPTFLYAMPFASDLLFVEETSLVRRPPMSHGLLRAKLHARMQHMGLSVREVVSREVCLIPMGAGLPYGDQRVIAYGAAASFVHPATGYQLARALRLAGKVADAILTGLSRGGPAKASEDAYRCMWPGSARRAWELYTFGMEVLADLDAENLRRFMSAFFALPRETWSGYMSGTLSAAQVASAMARLFVGVETKMKWSLLEAGARPSSLPLWRAVLSGGVP